MLRTLEAQTVLSSDIARLRLVYYHMISLEPQYRNARATHIEVISASDNANPKFPHSDSIMP